MNYVLQPPPSLTCNPHTLSTIYLKCQANSTEVSYSWYYTNDIQEARNGIGNRINVTSNNQYNITRTSNGISRLTFNVTNTTIGFYWCMVSSTKYSSTAIRHSRITPICESYFYLNFFPGPCSNVFVDAAHYITKECIFDNVTISLVPLPDNCISVSSINTVDSSPAIVPSSVATSFLIELLISYSTIQTLFITNTFATSNVLPMPTLSSSSHALFNSISPTITSSIHYNSSSISFITTPTTDTQLSEDCFQTNSLMIIIGGLLGIIIILLITLVLVTVGMKCYYRHHLIRKPHDITMKGKK